MRSIDQCDSNLLHVTIATTTNSSFEFANENAEYPMWHLIFWVSPHFQMFLVSLMIALFAIPVSYLTGMVPQVKRLI